MITWRLKKSQGEDLRRGHPWGFARDLDLGSSSAPAGSFVRIVDEKNQMLAFGYGNPGTALAFRALPLKDHPHLASMASVGPNSTEFQDWVVEHLQKSWQQRRDQGFQGSYRLVFSEVDGLPGLILDRYELAHSAGQVLAAQILTAGMERIWGDGYGLMQKLVERMGLQPWDETVVVERKDASIRKLEGLPVLPSRFVHFGNAVAGGEVKEREDYLRRVPVKVQFRGPQDKDDEFVVLKADLWEGQKTGFFLDQSQNMEIVLRELARQIPTGGRLRMLDLCCYVGHWSLQAGRMAQSRALDFSSALVDVSSEALDRAQDNLKSAGLAAEIFEVDVMKDLKAWPEGPFDLVVADPPAFVKAKKDRPTGLHAYLKMNTEALLKIRPGGWLVTCSCSGLVSEADLLEMLPRALARAGRQGRILARGQQGLDHPWDPHFPEGHYLKMILTQVF